MRAALVLALGGCSFLYARPPSGNGSASCSLAPPVTDTVVTVGEAALVIATLTGHTPCDGCPAYFFIPFFVSLATVVPFGISAGYGYEMHARCHRADDEPRRADVAAPAVPRPRTEREEAERAATLQREAREKARAIMVDAATAARAGDCAAVTAADAQVRALDIELHDTVFVRDAAIARCLGR
jgi:hypothetical protein